MSRGGLFRGNSRKTKNKLEMSDYRGVFGAVLWKNSVFIHISAIFLRRYLV